jgi:hypothetical protein
MPETKCAECAQPFAVEHWTRRCPHCGAEKAAKCSVCDTPIWVGSTTCPEHYRATEASVGTGPAAPAPAPTPTPSASPTGPAVPGSWPGRQDRAGSPHSTVGAPPRRRRTRLLLLALPVLGLGAAAAYSLVPDIRDDDPPVAQERVEQVEEVSAGEPDTTTFCGHLRVVSEYDAQAEAMLRQGAAWTAVQQMFRERTPAVSAAYAGAESSAPEHLRASVETLRRFTDDTAGVVNTAQSVAEFREYLVTTARTEAIAAGRASQAVDGYTRSTCGFSLHSEDN